MNLPNKLTVIRMGLIPILLLIYFLQPFVQTVVFFQETFTINELLIFFIFVAASITDLLDGNIARKHNLITTFGKFMDPIADKMLVNTVLFILALEGLIHPIIFIIMFFRDIIVDGIRMLAASSGEVIAAGNLGKLKTVLQMLAITLLLIKNVPFNLINFPLGQILMIGATIISVVSGSQYFYNARKLIFKSI